MGGADPQESAHPLESHLVWPVSYAGRTMQAGAQKARWTHHPKEAVDGSEASVSQVHGQAADARTSRAYDSDNPRAASEEHRASEEHL